MKGNMDFRQKIDWFRVLRRFSNISAISRRKREQDQAPQRSKHPLLTGHTCHVPQAKPRHTGYPAAEANTETTAKQSVLNKPFNTWPSDNL
jgi:hypothetical protein